jgi:predicted nucleic acid-binding protein
MRLFGWHDSFYCLCVGTLGVLLRAKQASLINAVAPIIGAMVAQGLYISPALHA